MSATAHFIGWPDSTVKAQQQSAPHDHLAMFNKTSTFVLQLLLRLLLEASIAVQ
jgi:hypothetical protein